MLKINTPIPFKYIKCSTGYIYIYIFIFKKGDSYKKKDFIVDQKLK